MQGCISIIPCLVSTAGFGMTCSISENLPDVGRVMIKPSAVLLTALATVLKFCGQHACGRDWLYLAVVNDFLCLHVVASLKLELREALRQCAQKSLGGYHRVLTDKIPT